MVVDAQLFNIYVGSFLTGALAIGLVPMLVFFVKGRPLFGFLSLLVCGALGIINAWVSVAGGVILLIAAIILKPNNKRRKK